MLIAPGAMSTVGVGSGDRGSQLTCWRHVTVPVVPPWSHNARLGHGHRLRRGRQRGGEMAAAVQAVAGQIRLRGIRRRIRRRIKRADHGMPVGLSRQEFGEITGLTRRHHAQPQHEYRQGERRQTHRTAQRGKAEIGRLAADHRRVVYPKPTGLHNFNMASTIATPEQDSTGGPRRIEPVQWPPLNLSIMLKLSPVRRSLLRPCPAHYSISSLR